MCWVVAEIVPRPSIHFTEPPCSPHILRSSTHVPFLPSAWPSIKKVDSIPPFTIQTMTIPPNDAFTLASHSDSTPSLRSSRSRSLTRSPSPKISFTPSQHAASGDTKRRPSRRQRKSNGFVSDSVKLADVDEALERALNGNGHPNGVAAHHKPIASSAQAQKIDWEIPRKALHSSIGMSRDFMTPRWHDLLSSGRLTISFQVL